MKKILIIEDDPSISNGLEIAFKNEKFNVKTINDGSVGYNEALKKDFDLMILDLMLPSKNGFEICKELRINNVQKPILMLTSKANEIDKVLGLEIGADDYVTKPFSIRELLARVNALIRRAENRPHDDLITFGNIKVNFKNNEVTKETESIFLTVTELKLLKYFIEHEAEVLSRDQLLNEVWGYDHFPTTRTIDNYVLSLRKKLEPDYTHPVHFITIHTTGYKFIK
ncbi:MAG TPA: response regulator transcription factor [Ignavibacteriaceae bacterium]|nr:response regulator transcription factor [Ignavibacteriaceae bacterium]